MKMEFLLDDAALRVDRHKNLLLVRDRLPGFVRPPNPKAWQLLTRVRPFAADTAARYPGSSAVLNVLPSRVRDGIAATAALTQMLANTLPVCHLCRSSYVGGLPVRAFGRLLNLGSGVMSRRDRARVVSTLPEARAFLLPVIGTPATPWEDGELVDVVGEFIGSVEAADNRLV